MAECVRTCYFARSLDRRSGAPGPLSVLSARSMPWHALWFHRVADRARHQEQSLVQEFGCGTLLNLVMANGSLKDLVADANGVKTVLDAMRHYPMQAWAATT
eukprot:6180393-Pleurochrysis_carterae.AAC.2